MRTLTTFAAIIAAFSSFIYYLDSHLTSFYIFDPTTLHTLAQSAIATHGNDTAAIISHITSSLSTTHAPHINLDQEWIFNNAGGAMGAMYIIHASITEYLIIFGTAVGTEGHSGRHTADNYFHILSGEQLAWRPGKGRFEPDRYPQGSQHVLRRGEVEQYAMKEACFALEYMRGWIPPLLPFGFADGLTGTLDLYTLWRTTYVTGREMIGNLMLGKF